MSAASKLAQIQVKIQRGREHLEELRKEIGTFYATKPYEVTPKRNPSRGLIYYVSKVDPVPTHLATIAGDVIQNLRSALDHLSWQLFLVGGGTANARNIYFPIAKDALSSASKLNELRRMGVRANAIAVFDSIQPFKSGNDEKLWVLHNLNIIDKHRLLVTVGSAFRSINLGKYVTTRSAPGFEEFFAKQGKPFTMPKMNVFFKTADSGNPLEIGKELFIDKVDNPVIPDLFLFHVVLNEVGVIQGASLLETINDFINVVEAVVKQFEPCLT